MAIFDAMSKPLTPKQEAFAQWYVSCGNGSAAYRAAYDAAGSSDATIWTRASELLKHSGVAARIAELQAEVRAANAWTREDSIRILAEIARSRTEFNAAGKVVKIGAKDSDKVSALKELNAMHGFNAPSKVELSGRIQSVTRRIVDPKAGA